MDFINKSNSKKRPIKTDTSQEPNYQWPSESPVFKRKFQKKDHSEQSATSDEHSPIKGLKTKRYFHYNNHNDDFSVKGQYSAKGSHVQGHSEGFGKNHFSKGSGQLQSNKYQKNFGSKFENVDMKEKQLTHKDGNRNVSAEVKEIFDCVLRLADLFSRSGEDGQMSLANDISMAIEFHEYQVVRDERTCSVINKMVKYLSAEQIMNILKKCQSKAKLKPLIIERHSCEFLEKCLNKLLKLCRHKEPLTYLDEQALELCTNLVEILSESFEELRVHFFVAFLINSLVCFLCQTDMELKANRDGNFSSKESKPAEGTVKNKDLFSEDTKNDVSETHKALLLKLVNVLHTDTFLQDVENTNFSTVFQNLLRALAIIDQYGDIERIFNEFFLTNVPGGLRSTDKKLLANEMVLMCQHKFYSRIVEVILSFRKQKLFKLLFKALEGSIGRLCVDPIGNHVMQKFFIYCPDKKDDLRMLLCEKVMEHVPQIFSSRESGYLLVKISNACLCSQNLEEKFFEEIGKALECTDENNIFKLLSYQVKQSNYSKSLTFSYSASMLLQSMLSGKSTKVLDQLCSSLLSSDNNFFVEICRSKYMNHIFASIAKSEHIKSNVKKQVLYRLLNENVLKILLHENCAQFVILDVFENEESVDVREKIVKSLIAVHSKGGVDVFQTLVGRRCNAKLYNEKPEQWKKFLFSRQNRPNNHQGNFQSDNKGHVQRQFKHHQTPKTSKPLNKQTAKNIGKKFGGKFQKHN